MEGISSRGEAEAIARRIWPKIKDPLRSGHLLIASNRMTAALRETKLRGADFVYVLALLTDRIRNEMKPAEGEPHGEEE